jgi:hypothetical protein
VSNTALRKRRKVVIQCTQYTHNFYVHVIHFIKRHWLGYTQLINFYSIPKFAPWNKDTVNHWGEPEHSKHSVSYERNIHWGAPEHSKHSVIYERNVPAGNRFPVVLPVIHHYINSALRKLLNSEHKTKSDGLWQWCIVKITNLFDIIHRPKFEDGNGLEYPKRVFQLKTRTTDNVQQIYLKTKL